MLLRVSETKIFWISCAVRLVSAVFLNHSFFVPDEYWQSLEVAHKLAFGYGEMTWEWREGIRSYIYPAVIGAIYKILYFLNIDTRKTLILVPRLFQALLSAVGDVYLYKLAVLFFQNPAVGLWAWVLFLTNAFSLYMSGRTLSNTLEAVLMTGLLYLYPWPHHVIHHRTASSRYYLSIAVVSLFLRPTSVLISGPLILWHFMRVGRKLIFLRNSIPLCTMVAFGCVYVDRVCYGRWLLTPWNFALFNVFRGGSAAFGSHPFLWYVYCGLPVTAGFMLPLAGLGVVFRSMRHCLHLLCVAVFYLAFHSFLAHKEFRFVYPVLPLLSIYAGDYVAGLCSSKHSTGAPTAGKAKQSPPPPDTQHSKLSMHQQQQSTGPNGPQQHSTYGQHRPQPSVPANLAVTPERYWLKAVPGAVKLMIWAYVSVNVGLALFLGLLHQRGTVDVMASLDRKVTGQPHASIWFLMPCHSTPFYSHMHRPIAMRFLHCEPQLNSIQNQKTQQRDEADSFHADPVVWFRSALGRLSRLAPKPTNLCAISIDRNTQQRDEADSFHADPVVWFRSALGRLPRIAPKPTHLVMYHWLGEQEDMADVLDGHGYRRCDRVFYSWIFERPRQSRYIDVFCR